MTTKKNKINSFKDYSNEKKNKKEIAKPSDEREMDETYRTRKRLHARVCPLDGRRAGKATELYAIWTRGDCLPETRRDLPTGNGNADLL